MVSNGSVSITTSSLAQGTHIITAMYGGDSNFGASFSAPFTVTVTAPVKSVTLTASPNPASAAQAVYLTATISPVSATGSVAFLNGTTILGYGTANNGLATLSGTTFSVGTYSLTASYSGDQNNPPVTSPALSLPVLNPTTVHVSSNPNPANPGQSVGFLASLTPSTATGSIPLLDSGTLLGSAIVSYGYATFSVTTLTSGAHSITAVYSGDANDFSATSPVFSENVRARPVQEGIDFCRTRKRGIRTVSPVHAGAFDPGFG